MTITEHFTEFTEYQLLNLLCNKTSNARIT